MTHILIFIHWFVLVFTFGNVELVTIDNSKSNDFPIEELNGYTLREVFEDGNLVVNGDLKVDTNIDNIPNEFIIGGIGYISTVSLNGGLWVLNQEQIIQSGVSFRSIRYDVVLNTLNEYLVVTETKSNNTLLRQYLGATSFKEKTLIPNEWNTILNYIRPSGNNMYIGYNQLGVFEIRKIMIIDVVSLGISHLTVEQMSDWYNVYQQNNEREISDTYDYIENELTTNDLIYIVLFALLWGLGFRIVKELL